MIDKSMSEITSIEKVSPDTIADLCHFQCLSAVKKIDFVSCSLETKLETRKIVCCVGN